MVGQLGLGDKEVGWLASADMAGSAIASLSIMAFISHVNWRTTTYKAILFVIAGNIASIFMNGFASLMVVRLLTGFSNGLILSIVFVGLCHSSNPDRYFGIYVFTQLSLQALLLAVLPIVLNAHGMPAIYLILAGASGVSSLLVAMFPTNVLQTVPPLQDADLRRISDTPHHSTLPSKWGAMALAAQGIYFLAPAAVWGYFESIGERFTLSIGQVGSALGLASIAGIAGSLVVIILGVRVERMVCMGLGTVISIVTVFLLMDGSGYLRYLLAACLFMFAWNYTFPYQMGVLSIFDKFGSVAIMSLVAQLFGLAFGPMLASFLLFNDGYKFILWMCAACYVTSFIMFFVSNSRSTGKGLHKPQLARGN